MTDRIRHKLVSIARISGWGRAQADAAGTAAMEFALRSPRGEGVLRLDTVAMPEDMGVFDLERVRRLAERKNSPPAMPFPGKRFDVIEWSREGLVCVGYSVICDFGAGASAALLEEYLQSVPDEERERHRKEVPGLRPDVHRDWSLARGTDVANVWYRSPHDDHVAADIVDCEEMVRSIRFERG